MKSLTRLILLGGMLTCPLSFAADNAKPTSVRLDTSLSTGTVQASTRVQALLKSLTLEEKIGQMTQITLGILREDTPNGGKRFNPKKLKEAINTYHVGSILNNDGQMMTTSDWRNLLTEINQASTRNSAKVPVIYGIDSIHGASYVKEATLFPHNIGLASARDTHLISTLAIATAKQTRAAGIRWNFDTVLDVGRQPLWPRFEETFGEDTRIVSDMGIAAYKGYQSSPLNSAEGVATSMKHFVGYGEPHNGKDRTPSYIPEKQLWETHMPPFEAAIDLGVPTLMVNSGTLNGVAVHADRKLLVDVVRKQLGFDGVIVSDWEDIIRLHTRHRVAKTPEHAVEIGINAGIDMSMVPEDYSFFVHLKNLVKAGKISEARIDESVLRILTLKEKVGLLDNPAPEQDAFKNADLPEYRTLALKAANASMVLLKNSNNILPLKKTDNILLAGPGADSRTTLGGSWSFIWQGNDESTYPDNFLSIKDALMDYLGDTNKGEEQKVLNVSKRPFGHPINTDIRVFDQDLSHIDKIILVLGEEAYAETPGGIDNLDLAKSQLAFATAAIKTGKPVVLVLTEGRPRIVRDIEPAMQAVLLAHRPGTLGAQAIVETLYGDNNPSGKLAYSYPRFSGDILAYDHEYSAALRNPTPPVIHDRAYNPQWPFGHGLSYTQFKFSNIKVDKKRFKRGDSITVSVKLKNIGKRAGGTGVDVFITDHYAQESPAVRRLKAFSHEQLKKGQQKTLEYTLDFEDFSYVRRSLKRVVEPGKFTIAIGSEKIEVELTE